jgi:hypothetical protein
MSQREHNKYLCTLKDLHIAIEKILQQITLKHTGESCSKCGGVCCKEEICRESIESAFLRFILGKEVVKYRDDTGWYMPKTGCQLKFGRPLICYEYLCTGLRNKRVDEFVQISRKLISIYSNVSGKKHILEIDDVSKIKFHKLKQIIDKLKTLKEEANNVLRCSGES